MCVCVCVCVCVVVRALALDTAPKLADEEHKDLLAMNSRVYRKICKIKNNK